MSKVTTVAMDENTVWAIIDRQRLGLADLLDDLTDEEWNQPSLCAGWRVREVAAHLALAHAGPLWAGVNLMRAAGSFDRMVRDTARRHATAPTAQLSAQIRAMIGSRKRAPGVTHLEPLIDVLVHGQDITIPLGRPRSMPVEAAATAATRVWTMRWPLDTAFRARSRLAGTQLTATDTDWSVGEGPQVAGPIEALLLLLTGRSVSLRRLSGPGADRLRNPGDT